MSRVTCPFQQTWQPIPSPSRYSNEKIHEGVLYTIRRRIKFNEGNAYFTWVDRGKRQKSKEWRIKGGKREGYSPPLNRVNSDSSNFLECRPIIFLILASHSCFPLPRLHSSPFIPFLDLFRVLGIPRGNEINFTLRNDLYRSFSFPLDERVLTLAP